MKRSRFSEEQIIGILKEHQAGLSAAQLCRKHGVSEPTFYKWRSKYGGLEGEPSSAIGPRTMASEAKRLRALEEENVKLKKLVAEAMMDGCIVAPLVRATMATRSARRSEKASEVPVQGGSP